MPRPDPIVQAKRVRLVDDSYPTDERRRVAEYIDDNWNDADGITLTEIADATDTSRQHVKNTLQSHFDIVEGPDMSSNRPRQDLGNVVEIILRAYRMGYRDGQQELEEEGSVDELIREVR